MALLSDRALAQCVGGPGFSPHHRQGKPLNYSHAALQFLLFGPENALSPDPPSFLFPCNLHFWHGHISQGLGVGGESSYPSSSPISNYGVSSGDPQKKN